MAQSVRSQPRLWPKDGIRLQVTNPNGKTWEVRALYETRCFYYFKIGRCPKVMKGYKIEVKA